MNSKRRTDASSTCLRLKVSRLVEGRRSAKPCARRCYPPANSLAGISIPPIVANRVAGAGQPLLIASQLFQYFGSKEFSAVTGRVSKWFQQAGRDQHGNFMGFKTEKPGGLGRIETRWSNLPT